MGTADRSSQRQRSGRFVLTIRLDDATWARLDALQRRARDAGMDLAIEAALGDYLARQIARTERELTSDRLVRSTEEGGGG